MKKILTAVSAVFGLVVNDCYRQFYMLFFCIRAANIMRQHAII